MIGLSRPIGLCAMLLAGTGSLPAATYTVGADAACTHSTLSAALTSAAANPGTDTIRVARNQSYLATGINISNQSVILAGGHDSCTDPTASGRTVLDGAGGSADSVIEILLGDGVAHEITLRDLAITGGEPDGDFGGGIEIDGPHVLRLENVTVSGNQSGRGGGIHVNGSPGTTLLLDADTVFFGNLATDTGGAIHCQGTQSTAVRIDGNLFDNEALNGGGIHSDGCLIVLNAPTPGDGVYFNRASGTGGGIHARNNSLVYGLGRSHHLLNLSLNEAGTDGGAVWLDASRLYLAGAVLNDNIAGRFGGAVHAQSGSRVTIGTLSSCQGAQRCSRIEGNLAGSRAGAISLAGNRLELYRTWVIGNHAPASSALEAAGSIVTLEGNVIARNAGAPTALQFVASDLYAHHNTITAHADAATVLTGTFGTLHLRNSILYEAGGILPFSWAHISQGALIQCLNASLLPAIIIGLHSTAADPAFANPGADDFRLSPASPGIDYCEDSAPPGSIGLDIDHQGRGFDVPAVVDDRGPFDAGADEWRDDLFRDGLEDPLLPPF
jgi:predicted outer membrane repeat protein